MLGRKGKSRRTPPQPLPSTPIFSSPLQSICHQILWVLPLKYLPHLASSYYPSAMVLFHVGCGSRLPTGPLCLRFPLFVTEGRLKTRQASCTYSHLRALPLTHTCSCWPTLVLPRFSSYISILSGQVTWLVSPPSRSICPRDSHSSLWSRKWAHSMLFVWGSGTRAHSLHALRKCFPPILPF